MARFGLKSVAGITLMTAMVGTSGLTAVYAQNSSPGPYGTTINRNLNDNGNIRFQEQGRPLKDKNNPRATTGAGSQKDKGAKKDIK